MKSLLYLTVASLATLFVLGGLVHPTPPGGVDSLYYFVIFAIPLAAYFHAPRLSVAICYGFACGLVVAWPVFVDGRTALRAEYGVESAGHLFRNLVLFATAVTLSCGVAYGLRRLRSRRIEVQPPD